jgi:putative oxidoreductase
LANASGLNEQGGVSMPAKFDWVEAPARVLIALLFLISATTKVTETHAIQGYMQAVGLPPILIWPAALFEYGSGALIVVGLFIRPVSVLLAGWCVVTALFFHTAFSDGLQLMHFFKNMTMAGSFLLIAKTHPVAYSLDAYLMSRTRAVAKA